MPHDQPTPEAEQDPRPEVLSYAPPDPPTVSWAKVFAHAMATFVAMTAITIFAGAASQPSNGWSALLIPIAFAAFVIMAFDARRRPGGRSLEIGIWIGICMPLLIAGLCFGAASMR